MASQTVVAGGVAVAAGVAASLVSRSANFESIWTVLNTFQLIIVIALLEIDYPPKVEAFFHGFEFASLNLPQEWNFVQKYMP